MISSDLNTMAREYVKGRVPLEALESWLYSALPSFDFDQQGSAADLAATIELGLAEIADRLITESEFRQRIFSAVMEPTLTVRWIVNVPGTHAEDVTSGSSNETVGMSERWLSATTWQQETGNMRRITPVGPLAE